MSKTKPEPIDPLFEKMTYDEVILEVERYKASLKDFKVKRNFVQQERELMEGYYKISIDEQKTIEAHIEKVAREIENLDIQQKVEIAAYSNKFQHLEYEHDIFLTKTLPNEAQLAVEEEEKIKRKREEIFFQDKQDLKISIKIDNDENRAKIESEQALLKKRLDNFEKSLKDNLKNVKKNYEEKIKNLEADLELRLKIEIHELEERKNLHRNVLVKTFDERMAAWKQDNINQIKENINLIKNYTNNYDDLVAENKQLMLEETELIKLIIQKRKELEDSKQKHSAIMNRLAKYYNQEINMSNMKAKIISLKGKINDTQNITEEALLKKERLMKEISEIMTKYQNAVDRFKERAEYKNALLDNQIGFLNERFLNRDKEIEDILKHVDQIAREEDSSRGFNRETIKNFLDDIKTVLVTKTQIIKSLKYSIDKATKAYNDTIRIYEAKLIDFGIPPEELGYQLLESGTSKMPAGLVSA